MIMYNTKTVDQLWGRLSHGAQKSPCRIVFPEGEDVRIITAAERLVSQSLAYPVLLGNPEKITACAQQERVSLKGIELINPPDNPNREQYISALLDIRKHKGLTREKAEMLVNDILVHGCLMVRSNNVNGFVGGATRTTADTIRAGLMVLGVEKKIKTLSGAFLMHVTGSRYGAGGWFVYADCAVIPHPTPEQLADIAEASAKTFSIFIGEEPRIAFLSFSTRGSANDESLQGIRRAVSIVKKRSPHVHIDGELQVDAALDMDIASKKIKGEVSDVAGRANILIFPDLNAGNIAYKLTQRLAGAEAVGPVLQGLNGAVNDLSRGCSVDDIVKIALVTSAQARGIA